MLVAFSPQAEDLWAFPLFSKKVTDQKQALAIAYSESDLDEELVGGQKNIDKNKNGKLDAEDFKLLRKNK